MAKTFLTLTISLLIFVLVGCRAADTGESQLIPAELKTVTDLELSGGESDQVENLIAKRQAYRNALESLVQFYDDNGNQLKLKWAKKELGALEDMPQYHYIMDAVVQGPELKASESVSEADYMYYDALRTEKEARKLLVVTDEDTLRMAMNLYNAMIRKFPTSDKIDDAAFRVAGILEHFKDYSLALIYYQRTYQWDPKTIHPAKYKAARIMDDYLRKRDDALKLYQEVVEDANVQPMYRDYAQTRILEITKVKDAAQQ